MNLTRLSAILFLFVTSTANGFDAFEIQVYEGRVSSPGQLSLETHLNTVVSGAPPKSPDQVPTDHSTHLTFEFARGMTDWWELGAYLQVAATEAPRGYFGGVKLRSKFVVPNQEHWHLGLNFELSNSPAGFDEDVWGGEMRPIIGYEFDRWTFLFNPILELNLSGWGKLTPDFAPALKGMFHATDQLGIGLEYYGEYGPLNELNVRDAEQHYLFLAGDLLKGPIEFNFGIGRGMTPNADRLIVKTIVGFDF